MSSSEDDDQVPSSPPVQSAQQPADPLQTEASDYVSDAPSDLSPDSRQLSPRESTAGDDPVANQAISREPTSDDDPVANQAIPDENQGSSDTDSPNSKSLPSRPNKFHGPRSTWRNWTAPERDLAASVNQLQAKDLSIHLYNSFKLRRRNQGSEANEGSQWVPPKVWTAWPLPSDIVPKDHDENRWEDDDTVLPKLHPKSGRPGQQLQEMLVAQILRKAKELFLERQWEDEQHPAKTTVRQSEDLQAQTHADGRLNPSKDLELPDQKPVIMADDQRAGEILRPTVQHIMTKLDGLLLGLHHARSAYLAFEESGSESQSLTSERSTSRGRPRKRKQTASQAGEDAETSQNTPNHAGSNSDGERPRKKKSATKKKAQTFYQRKSRLGLRDWSDVLGVASMTGWHQKVVGNATTRCATLFEEGIKFRTLEEGREMHGEDSYLPNASPPVCGHNSQSKTWRAREGSSKRFTGTKVGAVHLDGFLKPIEGKKSWRYNKQQSKRRQSSRESS